MTEARDIAEALAVGSESSGYKCRQTGLRKVCPRCKRHGWVLLFDMPDILKGGEKVAQAAIVWDGKSQCPAKDQAMMGGSWSVDVDTCDPLEVFRPTFGCGYDA